jgi:pimeloyl-ACP methyl ester carboxylesterase
VSTGRAPVAGGELAYDVDGQGVPLVLVHEGICDRRMWDDVWGPLAARCRVARYDMRGFGESSVPAGTFVPYEDAIAVLDHLGFEAAVLCGVSFGGSVVLDAALAQPGRVLGLVLTCCNARGMQPPAELRARMDEADAVGEAGDLDRAVELELQIWLDGEGRTVPVDARVRERVREMNRGVWERALESEGSAEWLDPPAASRLADVSAPTLVVAGEYDQPWMTESCRTLAREIPGARFELVAGAAHAPPLERPDVFTQLLLDAIENVEVIASG